MKIPIHKDSPPPLPVPPVERWLAPVTQFLHIEAASGIVLLACTAIALTLANSSAAAWFAGIGRPRFLFGSAVSRWPATSAT